MMANNTIFHPDTLKILKWIATLIKKEMPELPKNSAELITARKALEFIQGIKPAANELDNPETNPPENMHQTNMFET